MSPVAAAPVPSEERVFALDVIRGVALLGIFIMNMPGFVASFYSGKVGFNDWPAWSDRWLELLRNLLLGGKFNSMFSFLFGVGFTLQFMRLLEREGPLGYQTYVRRLLALLTFGVLHACVFWTGDVLHIYALLGFLLLALRNTSDRTLVGLIVLCVITPPALSLARLFLGLPNSYSLAPQVFEAWRNSNNAAYGHGTFVEAAREHTREMQFLYSDGGSIVYVMAFYLQMATTMLIGVLAGRQRWVQNAAQLMPTMIIWQWSMLVVGLASGVIYAYGEVHDLMFTNPLWAIGISFAYVLCRLGLVTFYVVGLLRLTLHTEWQVRLRPIALVGRMPLTNYLLQTLMATFIFYGWGLGYWNRGTPVTWFALAVLLYLLVQVPLSALWMARFKYGPMEYVWRLLTYGYRSLRNAPALAPQGAPGAMDLHERPPLIEATVEPQLQPRDLPAEESTDAAQPSLPPGSQTPA
jgi:uncharacterized protein